MDIEILACIAIGIAFLVGVHCATTGESVFGSRTQRKAIKVKLRELND